MENYNGCGLGHADESLLPDGSRGDVGFLEYKVLYCPDQVLAPQRALWPCGSGLCHRDRHEALRCAHGAEQPELLRTLRGLRKTQGAAFLFGRGFKNL